MLTDKQKQAYTNKPVVCPYCQSDDIDTRECVQIDSNVGTQGVRCLECYKQWTDVYRLVDVEDGEA